MTNAVREEMAGLTQQREADSLGTNSCWALDRYRQEREGTMSVGGFSAMVVEGDNLLIYDLTIFSLVPPWALGNGAGQC